MENATFTLSNGQEVTLTCSDMSDIHAHYEIQCTADYIRENLSQWTKRHLSEDTIQDLAAEARRQMDKYGYCEEEAIEEAFGYYDINEDVDVDNLDSLWAEVSCKYYSEQEEKWYVSAWETSDEDDLGTYIATIDNEGNVEYLNEDAEDDEYAQYIISQKVEELSFNKQTL